MMDGRGGRFEDDSVILKFNEVARAVLTVFRPNMGPPEMDIRKKNWLAEVKMW
jgi:hypothetical protein